ncbi:hypothetical protein JOM56_003369 [Amanita muscaria]
MDDNSRPFKRIKLDNPEHDILGDPSLQRRASDICESGSAGNGFLSGKVFMAWAPSPSSTKLQAIMETQEASDYGAQNSQKFYIIFTGACTQFFKDLTLQPRDEISLSLKGAHVEKTDKILGSCTLQMRLVYSEGVILMVRKSASGLDAGKVIDTWKLSEGHWFVSPDPPEPEPSTEVAEELTKKETKRRAKVQREKAKSTSADNDKYIKLGESRTIDQDLIKKSPAGRVASPGQPSETNASASRVLKPGLQTPTHKYQPLREVSLGQEVNLIGLLVNASSPTRTRTGDWCINVKLVDPSSAAKAGTTSPEAFSVNCFTKRHASWLPQSTIGNALMLRHVQIHTAQRHLKGTAYHGRFQWAIYTPNGKQLHHAEPGAQDVSSWTPFFDPCPSEIDYCVGLFEWWHGMENKEGRHVQQIDPSQAVSSYEGAGGVRRLHRLVKDAGPDVPPNGYFDCTVEVIHGHQNDNDVYSLFVTDYTKNGLISPTQLDWCPDGLGEYILKLEMWDAAAKIGPTMEPGTYYSITNARMRVSRGGYVEGKVVLPKIVRLNEEDADRIPKLNDLLERKKIWNSQHGAALEIEDRLIEEAIENQFFNCVVEVLHVIDNGYGPPAIFVTDYTEHPYLSRFEGEWCRGLERRVVRISLWDCHTTIAKSIAPGFYLSLKKLRLNLNARGDCFEGELRGHERLLHQLNPKKPSNDLQRLIQRKECFLRRLDVKGSQKTPLKSAFGASTPQTPEVSGEQQSPSCREELQQSNGLNHEILVTESCQKHESTEREDMAAVLQQYTSLQAMMNHESCPDKFLVRARIVDFYPFSLKDCSQQWCSRCKNQIPSKFKACIDCADTEHEYVMIRYQTFLMLEDDEGTTVGVSAYDKSHLFDGLERANFSDNNEAYESFCARLRPLLGNLVEVHENGRVGIEILPQTKVHELEIVSWEGPDGQIAFGLFCRRDSYNGNDV